MRARTAAAPAGPLEFVLVHGAYHGGWCWRRVVDRLRARGHSVFTPTLTGLGERCHQLDASVSLDTWIQDVVGVIECEELSDVVLVGHSFGGTVISGVAERAALQLRGLVYLDGFLVPDGRSPVEMAPPGESERRASATGAVATDLALPPPPPAYFGVEDPDDAAWLKRRMTPQPIRPFLEPVHLDRPPGHGLPSTYIVCTAHNSEIGARSREMARSLSGWRWRELPCGHDAMVVAPDAVSELLLETAASPAEQPVRSK